MLDYERFAEPGTKGRRKTSRAHVRNILGTSSDPAPELNQILAAANKLQGMLDLASGGRYGLAVVELGLMADYRARGLDYLPTKTISGTMAHVDRVARRELPGSNRMPYDLTGTP